MRLRSGALAIALGVGLAGNVEALSLGSNFTVGNLSFSDFVISITGAIDHNLGDYQVIPLTDGFRILPNPGSISVSNAAQGDMLVSYDVRVTDGAVSAIQLGFDGAFATGPHSGATVSEDLFETPGGDFIASALVFQTGSGLSRVADSASFAPRTGFHVEKDILVTADAGGTASIASIDQHFAVVPEPGAGLLFGSGIVGLVMLGRRRLRG